MSAIEGEAGEGRARLDLPFDLTASTTAADILELGGGSSVFLDERVFVGGARCVGFNRRWLVLFRKRGRIVTSQSLARALDRATVWPCGTSALRACAEHQHGDNPFHSNSFAGNMAGQVCTEDLNQRQMAQHSANETRSNAFGLVGC
jgi:hypothetical protein